MKTVFNKNQAIFLALILGFTSFQSCQDTNESQKTIQELAQDYPHEWMYNQRAYPNNHFNKSAMKDAVTMTKSIVASRSQRAGADWTLKGPINTGGRITDVAISPDNDDHFYVSTAVGGVFKTTDAGANWSPIFDAIGKPSIGNIAIAASNADVIYVGTGEANGSATSGAFFGDGIYRSDDAGTTWNNVGLPDSNHIGRLVIDPTNPDRVFAAATGVLYGQNDARGIYRTTDGGANWERVLFVTDGTAAIDVVMNPQNTDILFAAMWERTREPWQRDYGGLTSAIHKSTDGGDTWTELGAAHGLPAPDAQRGRLGLAISESNPATIYARYTTNEITNSFDAMYKSTDNGNNWSAIPTGPLGGVDASFGWYFGNIRVSPVDPDEVIILGQRIYKTTNSGTNWTEINGMHVDHHALEYSRQNGNLLLAGNDGGAYVSQNGGNTWSKFTNLPITQFYNIEVDNSDPTRLYGGTQDNNTIRTITGNTNDWNSIWGGDGMHVRVDPNDNNFIYVESQFGGIGRSINGGNTFMGATDGIDFADRNNWNTPIELSNFDSETVYCGTQRLYISDKAAFWNAISPDLTNGQHPSGSLSYGTLTAIGTSYESLNRIYTGSDDGNVQVTNDAGTTWTNVSSGLPDRYVTSIAVSPDDHDIAYVTFSGFGLLDYDPHVFKTIDGGQNWNDISSNLPSIPANDIIIDPANDYLYLATDLNVWFSHNDGASWTVLGNDLPLTITRDLKLHEPTNTLYAGTFGRSMHSYDLNNIILDVTEFGAISEKMILYPNPAKTQFTISHSFSSEGTIQLYDIQGRLIQELYRGGINPNENLEFSTEGLDTGVYFVRLTNGKESISAKLIIQ